MIKVGIIGAGAWGRNLLRNVASHEATALTAVCDVDAAARQSVSRAYPDTRIYERFADMLNDSRLDAIIIATPPSLHFEQAKSAIEAGLHVLVEKPVCTTSAEARRLTTLAETHGRVLMVGHTFLYSNLVHEVKRRIESGELGDVRCIYSQRLNLGRVRQDVDALWNFAPHDISIVSFLLDAWPRTVNARGAGFVQQPRQIADVAFFQMDFDGGRLMGGQVSWLDPQKVRRMVVVGSEKMLVYDDVDTQHHIQIYDKSVELQFQGATRDFCDFGTRVRAGDLLVPNIALTEPLGVEIGHWAECIRKGKRPLTDGTNGQRVVSVLEAMSRSMAAGGAMTPVDYDGTQQKQATASLTHVASELPVPAATP